MLCASVFWVRRTKSSSVAQMVELQDFRQSMVKDRMRSAPEERMGTQKHDNMFSNEGHTGFISVSDI